MFDFSKEGVLQAAVPLFEGLTLYANHDADVNDWKGLVQEPVWDGENKPNGINAKVVIDRTVDPKLARGVETKALRSFSVTIWFEYQKSHPDLAGFWDRMGEEVDGQIVRLIVTKITNAGEVSVVWEGEDPFAKSFEAGGEVQHDNPAPAQTPQEEATMKLTAATMALLGIAAETELTEELVNGRINEVVHELKTRIEELKPQADLGVKLLAETRTKAVTLYKALKGEKVVESFISGVIEKADLETARAFCQEYETEMDKTVPLKCGKCGEPVSRRSSQEAGDGKPNGDGKRPEDYKL